MLWSPRVPISPEFVTRLAGAVLSLAGGTEVAVAQAVAKRVGRDVGADAIGPKVESVRLLQAELLRIAHKFTSDVSPELQSAIERGAWEGRAQAVADMKRALGHLRRRGLSPNLDALINLAADLVAPVTDPAIVGAGILRSGVDVYRVAVARATSGVLLGAQTRREAAQQALDTWARRGVAAFRDARGRTWDLATYAEMSTRTAAQRAMTQAHTETLLADDVRLVIVSNAPQECERCRPWEGKVLAIGFQRGTSFPTLADAERAGLFHPNAVLGNQAVRALGSIENGVRSWYEGPSVHLTTANGNQVTVSPNHPVLTSNGWCAADLLREGDQVFTQSGAGSRGPSVVDEDFDQVPAMFDDVFDALRAHGLNTSVPAAADNLHGDGQFCQGEISVVWTDRGLLRVRDAMSREQLCDHMLMGADVEPLGFASAGAGLFDGHGVRLAIARPLADRHAEGSQPPTERRLADAEDPGEVLAGLACGVTADKIVKIDRQWFTGHAYDLQTETGAYLTGGILVHNCRHSIGAYIPGVTKPHAAPTADPEGDAARQQLRALERQVRAAKRLEAVALDEQAAKAARAKVRAGQAAIRAHLETPAGSRLARQPARERIGTAR